MNKSRACLASPAPSPSWSAERASLALALLLASCSTIDVQSEPQEAPGPGSIESYAWAGAATPSDEPDLDRRIREAIERELADLGIRPASSPEASMEVSYEARVDATVRTNDPDFDLYVVEEYETATLVIDLIDGATGESFWRGSGSRELRVSKVPVGPLATELTPTGAPRNWRIDELVAAIFAELVRSDPSRFAH